jgi:hypothetical protein
LTGLRERLTAKHGAALQLAALLMVACGDGGQAQPSPSSSAFGVPGVLGTALMPYASGATSATATALALDPRALKDVIAHVPAPLPRTSEGGTLIGTDASATPLASAAVSATSEQSLIDLRPDLKASNAGSEKDLRASLYFDLVDQCRDKAGKHLPAEAIEIEFRIDPRGRIDRTSVKAKASSPDHAAAADCMVRVIRTADARFATQRLDEPTRIRARVPSVD